MSVSSGTGCVIFSRTQIEAKSPIDVSTQTRLVQPWNEPSGFSHSIVSAAQTQHVQYLPLSRSGPP